MWVLLAAMLLGIAALALAMGLAARMLRGTK
jgi:hypothetical protein